MHRTTHDDAFLQAIIEAPDDDAPRLMYADWLEERGDPRGEFIRAQCVLERLDSEDPIRRELEDQAQALLDQHEEEWTAPLRGVASSYRFRRGFVEEAAVSGAGFLTRGDDLFAAVPITRLRIMLARGHVANVAASPHLARLRILDVSSCRLRDDGVTALLSSPYLGRLTGLDLSCNEVEGPALLRTLVESPLLARLTALNLNNNAALGLRALRTVVQSPAAAGLRSLDLSHTNIGLAGLRDLLASPFLKSLSALQAARVGGYVVGGLVAPDLAALPVLSRLTELDLSGFLASAGLSQLLRSPSLGHLTSLKLADCGLGSAETEMLADLPHFAGLQTLNITRNPIGRRGLERVAASENLSGLTALHLGHNGVRDAGAKALAASSTLTRLTNLDLNNNAIGGPGILALAASPNVARLTTLDLSGNYINLDSVRALAASPHLRRLRELRVVGAGRSAEEPTAILADAPDGPFVGQEQGWFRRRPAARRARNAPLPPGTMAG